MEISKLEDAIFLMKRIEKFSHQEIYSQMSSKMALLVTSVEDEQMCLKKLSIMAEDVIQPQLAEIFFQLSRKLEEEIDLLCELRSATRKIANQ